MLVRTSNECFLLNDGITLMFPSKMQFCLPARSLPSKQRRIFCPTFIFYIKVFKHSGILRNARPICVTSTCCDERVINAALGTILTHSFSWLLFETSRSGRHMPTGTFKVYRVCCHVFAFIFVK